MDAAPFEIVPGSRVWFGDANATYDSAFLSRITHVVNCESCFTSSSQEAQMKHFLFLKSYDDDTFPILATHFPTLLRYINTALQNPTAAVYIHCYAGQNRSATLAIAYACHLTKEPATSVIERVRQETSRNVVENESFYRQLITIFP